MPTFRPSLSLNLALAACLVAPLARGQKALPKILPAPKSQDQKMQWFREAKFGLFIHWGLYCIPGGRMEGAADQRDRRMDHEPRQDSGEGIRATRHAVQSGEVQCRRMGPDGGGRGNEVHRDHQQASRRLRHVPFAGQQIQHLRRHAVPSRSAEGTAASRARHHIKFGFYYSQAQDWHEPNGAGNTWDFGPDDKKDFDQYLRGRPSRR